MRPRIVAAPGPLDDAGLEEVGALYGRADGKYLRDDVRRHLLVRGPAGPALHARALEGERLVGHCAAVPMPARVDGRPLSCAKVEALFVDEEHRGRRGTEQPLVFDLLDALYELAGREAVELLHAYVRPDVGRVLRFDPIAVGQPTLVAVTGALPAAGRAATIAARALRVAHASARVLASRGSALLREPVAEDVDLVDAPHATAGTWTIAAEDVWDWCRSSPFVRVLEVDGRSRALLQLPGSAGDALRVAGWRSVEPTARNARRMLAGCLRLARELEASTVRVQPWPGMDAGVTRAARTLGFVARSDFTTLYVRAARPELAAARVTPTPLLYLGF